MHQRFLPSPCADVKIERCGMTECYILGEGIKLITHQVGRGLILLVRNAGVNAFQVFINKILGRDAPTNYYM